MGIFAQILGGLSAILYIIAVQQKTRTGNTLVLLFAVAIDSVQYFMLDNFASCISLVGSIWFLTIVWLYSRKGKDAPLLPVVLYWIYLPLVAILWWQGILPFVATMSSLAFSVYQWKNNMHMIRVFTLIVAITWFVNAVWTGAIFVCVGYAFEGVSATIAMYRYRNEKAICNQE